MLYKHAIRCHRTCMSNALYKILNSKEFVGIAKWKDKLWHRNNLCRIQGQCTHGKSLSPPKKTFSQYTWPIYYSPHIPTYNREHNAHKQAQAHLHAPDTINESLFLFNNSLCSNYISVAKKNKIHAMRDTTSDKSWVGAWEWGYLPFNIIIPACIEEINWHDWLLNTDHSL